MCFWCVVGGESSSRQGAFIKFWRPSNLNRFSRIIPHISSFILALISSRSPILFYVLWGEGIGRRYTRRKKSTVFAYVNTILPTSYGRTNFHSFFSGRAEFYLATRPTFGSDRNVTHLDRLTRIHMSVRETYIFLTAKVPSFMGWFTEAKNITFHFLRRLCHLDASSKTSWEARLCFSGSRWCDHCFWFRFFLWLHVKTKISMAEH